MGPKTVLNAISGGKSERQEPSGRREAGRPGLFFEGARRICIYRLKFVYYFINQLYTVVGLYPRVTGGAFARVVQIRSG